MWPFSKPQPEQQPTDDKLSEGFFSTHHPVSGESRSSIARKAIANTFRRNAAMDSKSAITTDSVESVKASMTYNMGGIPAGQLSWYGAQSFIGYQSCAMIAQHWLVNKCCSVPALDAIRKGWEITVNDGTEIDAEVIDAIRRYDDKYNLNKNLVEFVNLGRVFGIRIAMFKVNSTDPDYYEKPFNADGITPGSYKGISQIDPYWCAPELDGLDASDPSSINFYEPTYWTINGQRIHRSHLIIMRGPEVPDILKPTYLYGGISVPQMIYERVYGAERTANEAPQLTMTKRMKVLKMDAQAALANQQKFEENLAKSIYYQDNYSVFAIDKETEDATQLDTSLADLDAVIMTQYQLVASVANVPVTKLLGTVPKGFNSTGEYEEATYRELLESIQEFDLQPLIDRHHELLIRSVIAPEFGVNPFGVDTVFNQLDSLTEQELADINLKKAQTDQTLQSTGAIDGQDIRERIIADEQSGYNGIAQFEDEEPDDVEYENEGIE